MSDEEINIAIAESRGIYKQAHSGFFVGENWIGCAPPDYCNDLNAMHKVEGMIERSWDTYFEQLISIRFRDARPVCHPKDMSPAAATARQRAEAFLRTIGKWEEES